MIKNLSIICLIPLVLILNGCQLLPTPTPTPPNPNKNAKPAVIAWGGMYEIAVNFGKGNKTSYYHKAYSKHNNKAVKSIFKKMRTYFLSEKFRFSKFKSVQVVSMVDAKEEIDTKQLYTLILVPTIELANHNKWSEIHDHILYAGISALIVKPGEGRIVAASSGIVSKRYKSTQPLQENEFISYFRELYADAAAIALKHLQEQNLQPSHSRPSIITDVYVEDDRLSSLFAINGTRLEKVNCNTKHCQVLGNIAAQFAAQKLLRNGEFVLPPFTGMMSDFGSRWSWYAEEKMVNLVGVDLSSKARKPIKIKINPAESERFLTVHVTDSTEKNVSRTGNQIWNFSISGRINWCQNTIAKNSDHFIEGTRSQRIYCDKNRQSGTLMRFDNRDEPTEYRAGRSVPSDEDRKDNYLGSVLNALGG